MSSDSLTITDNRTGKTYEVPIENDTIRAIDLRNIKVADGDFGMMSYDPAFLSQFQTANNLEDLEEARRWYRRAADLGADEALQRLTALDAHFN